MSILVIAEHNNHQLKSATLTTLTAARQLGEDVQVLVAGEGCRGLAEQVARCAGVTKVLLADAAAYGQALAENLAQLVRDLAQGFSHVLAPATTFGKDLLPRAAALLDVEMISDIIAIESADTFRRPIFAGNAIATVRSLDEIKLITVRGIAFAAASTEGGSGHIESLDNLIEAAHTRYLGAEIAKSDRPELSAARVVVAGGRGFGAKENFQLVFDLADKLGAAVGASRAAVDAGYVPNDLQVGQTGKVVAPELYIALGISGAIQHLAGMQDSKVIVAINKDPEAPIFQVADYGLVADLFEALPELISKLG